MSALVALVTGTCASDVLNNVVTCFKSSVQFLTALNIVDLVQLSALSAGQADSGVQGSV